MADNTPLVHERVVFHTPSGQTRAAIVVQVHMWDLVDLKFPNGHVKREVRRVIGMGVGEDNGGRWERLPLEERGLTKDPPLRSHLPVPSGDALPLPLQSGATSVTIFLVMTNGTILAAYQRRDLAEVHQLTITGAQICEVIVENTLAQSARDDIHVESYDLDGETVVEGSESGSFSDNDPDCVQTVLIKKPKT